jgi:hypothetical protein
VSTVAGDKPASVLAVARNFCSMPPVRLLALWPTFLGVRYPYACACSLHNSFLDNARFISSSCICYGHRVPARRQVASGTFYSFKFGSVDVVQH